MDDVLDEWSTRVLILKREEAKEINTLDDIIGSSSSSSPTTCFCLKKLNCFSSIKQLPWRREIALRIKDINERIDSMFLDMEQFKLISKAVGNNGLNKIINYYDIARTTTSFIDESKFYGRDDDKDFLLKKVLSMNTEQEKSLQVISIVGLGGLGKTTLAQMVYNDEKVKEKFGRKRIWVCVSNSFDEVNVARHILEGLNVDHSKMTSLQALHQSVGESLSGDKFLLVLDDVWDENFGKWDKLSKCLMLGEPDGRILVTTRKEEVAKIMGTTPSNILKPQQISDLDCWFLISQRAFEGRTNTNNDELADIGIEIAKKCKGLPLAAKMLGGMLIPKYSVDEWKDILNSEIWELEQAEVELFPHIYLSYQELPAMLKRCFLILAIFPKDTQIEIEKVVGLWMAHGFLNQRTIEDDMVKKGTKHLEFLVSRGLLEKKYSRISMHDIMHDFALHFSRDELISTGEIEDYKDSKSILEKGSCLKLTTARHLYIGGDIGPISTGFDAKKLRTCFIQDGNVNATSDLVKGLNMVRALYLIHCYLEHLPASLEHFLHLRLLHLSDNLLVELPEAIGDLYNLQELFIRESHLSTLPNSIGKFTNLRLLTLNYNRLVELPETIGGLYNLQELCLQGCHLSTLPSSIGKLTNLRFLNLNYNDLVELPETIGDLYKLEQLCLEVFGLATLPNSMRKLTNLKLLTPYDLVLEKAPESLEKLINLQNLEEVRVEAGKRKLGLLKDLNQLRGVLEIKFESDYGDEVDIKKAEIGRKKHITELTLDFDRHEVTNGVIAALQPPSNIQVLQIFDLPESCDRLPCWITSLDHLTRLDIFGGGNISTLPPLWKLRSLKKLYVKHFPSLKIIGGEFIGLDCKPNKNCSYFPKLEELKFHFCNELTGWEDLKSEEEEQDSIMPNLKILKFDNCNKLHKLPHRLLGLAPSLETISINGKHSTFKFDVGESPCILTLGRFGQTLKMIVEGSTKVPKSIIYDSYFTLLDFYLGEPPFSYLPPLGKLPFLQSLTIGPSLKVIGRDFLGIDDPNNDEDFVAFPNLLRLEISSCPWLEKWEDLKQEDEGKVTVMPKLQRLEIKFCIRLQELPSRLLCQAPSLEEISCFIHVHKSLAENIMKDEQLLRHVKSVIVDEQCSLHP